MLLGKKYIDKKKIRYLIKFPTPYHKKYFNMSSNKDTGQQ